MPANGLSGMLPGMSFRSFLRAPGAMVVAALVLALALALPRASPGNTAVDLANAVFLVAKRHMRDPRFRETVLLVTQPRQGGPFGVIVNRPLRHRLAEVFPSHARLRAAQGVLYLGGPVARDGILFLVRTASPPARAVHVLHNVYLTADVKWVEARLERGGPVQGLRVFAGYAGWAPGQLQSELARGDWYVLPADAATIFEKDPSRIWPDLVERALARPARAGPRAGSAVLAAS